MKRKIIQLLIVVLMLIPASVFFSCDTSTKHHPYVIINVTLGSGEVPDTTKKLYMVFHFLPDWASPWLTLSSDTNTILVPPLNVGTIPLYFEIIYDINGHGNPTETGNWYQGWYGKIDRATPNLDPFIIPDVPVLIINIAMDKKVDLPLTVPVTPVGANYNVMP